MALVDILRKPHFMGFVIFDWVATFAGAACVSLYFNINYVLTLVVLLILSIFLHVYYKVDSKTNGYLGLNSDQ